MWFGEETDTWVKLRAGGDHCRSACRTPSPCIEAVRAGAALRVERPVWWEGWWAAVVTGGARRRYGGGLPPRGCRSKANGEMPLLSDVPRGPAGMRPSGARLYGIPTGVPVVAGVVRRPSAGDGKERRQLLGDQVALLGGEKR